ncbi:LPD29 domain-containing protein [Streptacidiphilus sp. EB129]|uniref:LPD29 domain-containing protein n=1 Tax=Streptacidiphilus sp. EB129 TaxID=3156262 RepID=UPI003511D5D4
MNEQNSSTRRITAAPGDAAEAERLAAEAIDATAAAYLYELHAADGGESARLVPTRSALLGVANALRRGKVVESDGRGTVTIQHRRKASATTYRPQPTSGDAASDKAQRGEVVPAVEARPGDVEPGEAGAVEPGGLELLTYGAGALPGLAALYRARLWTGAEWVACPAVDPDGQISGAALVPFLSAVFGPSGLLVREEDGVLSFSCTPVPDRPVSLRLEPVDGARVLAAGEPVGWASRFTAWTCEQPGAGWVRMADEDDNEVRAVAVQLFVTDGARGGVTATVDADGVVKLSGLLSPVIRLCPVPVAPAPVHLGSREVAKVLRQHLKARFPGARISVRCGTGTAYSWLSVSWTDGPSEAEVGAVCEPWHGSRFNGMTDGYDRCEPLMVALEPGALPVAVSPAVDGINYSREFSPETKGRALEILSAHYGRPITGHGDRSLPVTSIAGERIAGGSCWTQLKEVVDKVVLRSAQD